jgi:hypothetical protein
MRGRWDLLSVLEPCKITLENCNSFPKLLSWSKKNKITLVKSGAMIATIMVGNKASNSQSKQVTRGLMN